MGTDEVGTLKALKQHRRERIDPTIDHHNGRIVKTTGDGMLVEFASVVDAVVCAVAIQRAMLAFNTGIHSGPADHPAHRHQRRHARSGRRGRANSGRVLPSEMTIYCAPEWVD
jgi:class 3 adenylate cyclase